MTTPVLNEENIMKALDHPIAFEHQESIRLGSLLALIDAYDRKLEREPMVSLAHAAQNLAHLMGRVFAYEFIKGKITDKEYNDDDMDALIKTLTETAEFQRKKLFTLMKDVVQCPHDDDPIS